MSLNRVQYLIQINELEQLIDCGDLEGIKRAIKEYNLKARVQLNTLMIHAQMDIKNKFNAYSQHMVFI